MTKIEFLECMAFVEAAIGKTMPKEQAAVYFDLLGDLPAEALRMACKRVLLEHPWHTIPSIAELRQAASESLRGVICGLSPGEAWAKAWGAVKAMDPEIEGSVGRAMEGLPALVQEAIHAFGVNSLCYSKSPVEVLRAQFERLYADLAARDKRAALVPRQLADQVKRLPAALDAKVKAIGRVD